MSYSLFENMSVYYRGFSDPLMTYIFSNAVEIKFKEYDYFTVRDTKGNEVRFKYVLDKQE